MTDRLATPMTDRHDTTFACMGCTMRLLVEGEADVHAAAAAARERLHRVDARLSRFRADSELARLNRDPRPVVPASPLLRTAVRAALWAAERSDGLVDPTLLGDLEHAGYDRSLAGRPRVPLPTALAQAPPRVPARARTERRWRSVRVDRARGAVGRPPGLRLDTGGTTKGLAADAVARDLAATGARFVVDCGGDLRLSAGTGDAFEVVVDHPLTRTPATTIAVREGAVATSGPGRRLWRAPDGRVSHHLLDPASGEPAWTGLLSATALAPTALEAETLAKVAVLSGPAGARRALGRRGGVLIHDSGEVERVGPLARRSLRVRATRRGLEEVTR